MKLQVLLGKSNYKSHPASSIGLTGICRILKFKFWIFECSHFPNGGGSHGTIYGILGGIFGTLAGLFICCCGVFCFIKFKIDT